MFGESVEHMPFMHMCKMVSFNMRMVAFTSYFSIYFAYSINYLLCDSWLTMSGYNRCIADADTHIHSPHSLQTRHMPSSDMLDKSEPQNLIIETHDFAR